jgi:hypothetical protein
MSSTNGGTGTTIIRINTIRAMGMTSDLAIFPVLDPCIRAMSATLDLRCRFSVTHCR